MFWTTLFKYQCFVPTSCFVYPFPVVNQETVPNFLPVPRQGWKTSLFWICNFLCLHVMAEQKANTCMVLLYTLLKIKDTYWNLYIFSRCNQKSRNWIANITIQNWTLLQLCSKVVQQYHTIPWLTLPCFIYLVHHRTGCQGQGPGQWKRIRSLAVRWGGAG